MGSKYVLYSKAKEDLEQIFSYISLTLYQPGSAINLISKFEERFEMIVSFPFSYPILEDTELKIDDIRISNMMDYNIYYRYDELKQRVEVIRVLYKRLKK